jgi:Uma2 family endonuclease
MAKAGIIHEDDRLELIEGEIVEVSAIGSRHAGCVNGLNGTFSDRLRGRVVIGVQNPVRLGGRTEPEPDITLLRPRPDYYRRAHPVPEDVLLLIEVADTSQDYDRDIKAPLYAQYGIAVLLLIEVADTSQDYDRDTKAPLYARYGIAEYWIIDLEEDRIEVYRSPSPDGYLEVAMVERGERVLADRPGGGAHRGVP